MKGPASVHTAWPLITGLLLLHCQCLWPNKLPWRIAVHHHCISALTAFLCQCVGVLQHCTPVTYSTLQAPHTNAPPTVGQLNCQKYVAHNTTVQALQLLPSGTSGTFLVRHCLCGQTPDTSTSTHCNAPQHHNAIRTGDIFMLCPSCQTLRVW